MFRMGLFFASMFGNRGYAPLNPEMVAGKMLEFVNLLSALSKPHPPFFCHPLGILGILNPLAADSRLTSQAHIAPLW